MTEETPHKQPLGQGTMTKKRFAEFTSFVTDCYGEETASTIAKKLQEILNFDPNAPMYNQKRMEQTKAYRERKKAEGISTYLSTGAKAYYYRQKAKQEQTMV